MMLESESRPPLRRYGTGFNWEMVARIWTRVVSGTATDTCPQSRHKRPWVIGKRRTPSA